MRDIYIERVRRTRKMKEWKKWAENNAFFLPIFVVSKMFQWMVIKIQTLWITAKVASCTRISTETVQLHQILNPMNSLIRMALNHHQLL